MARSDYAYVLLIPGQPPMAWTVKRELASWLKRSLPGEIDPGARLWRCRDGRPEDATSTIDIRKLRDGEA